MEAIMEEIRTVSMSKVIKWVCATIMIFGGIVPYIPQYQEIYQKEDAEGFSLYVCLALLIANTLRILFWFGKRYELPLLLQSIVMNIMMLLMIHLCVKVRNKNQVIKPTVERTFTGGGKDEYNTTASTNNSFYSIQSFWDFDLRYFWQWTDFQSYVDFLLVMNITFSLITFICIHSTVFVEVLGFLAVFTEAMLGVPQLVKNLRQRSTEGMSVYMVLMWTAGDAFKTVYFIVREAPLQFWLCGALQVIIDLTILGQVYWYRNSIPSFRYSRAD